jgi:hypothetical protein
MSDPLIQQFARGNSPGGNDVSEVLAVAAQRRDLLSERGGDIGHETVRFWWNRFGPIFTDEIRKKRVARTSVAAVLSGWPLETSVQELGSNHLKLLS